MAFSCIGGTSGDSATRSGSDLGACSGVIRAWDGMSHRRRVAGLSACAAHARAIAARVATARSGDSEAAVALGATAALRRFGVTGAVL